MQQICGFLAEVDLIMISEHIGQKELALVVLLCKICTTLTYVFINRKHSGEIASVISELFGGDHVSIWILIAEVKLKRNLGIFHSALISLGDKGKLGASFSLITKSEGVLTHIVMSRWIVVSFTLLTLPSTLR